MATNLESAHWLKEAACKDKPLKIFASYDQADIEVAKAICKTCNVQRECLAYYNELSCVSAGLSRYDRLVLLWKRVENERGTNWSRPEKVFPRLFR